MDTPDERKPIMVGRLSVDLWKQLKIRAAVERQTLQRTLEKAIEHYLDNADRS